MFLDTLLLWLARPVFAAFVVYGAARLLATLLRRRRATPEALRRYFAGKTVVVTGASSGVGRELAIQLHACNARLVLMARSVDKLEELCKELNTSAPSNHAAQFRYLDVADVSEANLQQLAQELPGGRIDLLINNAGMSVRSSCEQTEMKVHRRLMDVNYFGQVAVTQALLPFLSEEGQIAVVSSVQGIIAVPLRAAYCTTKHAVQAYFDSLRAELEASGRRVGVLVFSPSYINTALSRHALTGAGRAFGDAAQPERHGMPPEYVAEQLLHAVRERREEVWLGPFVHKMACLLRPWWPEMYFRSIAARARKEMKDMKEKE